MEASISTDAAKSICRVMLATLAARITVGTVTTLDEADAPLTEIQTVEVIANAMMDYRTTADDAENSIDAEVVMDRMKTMTARGRVEWATEEEARKQWREFPPERL